MIIEKIKTWLFNKIYYSNKEYFKDIILNDFKMIEWIYFNPHLFIKFDERYGEKIINVDKNEKVNHILSGNVINNGPNDN